MSTQKKQLRENPLFVFIILVFGPTVVFAWLDEQYWAILSSEFGLGNSWHLVTVDLQVSHNNQILTHTYLNSPFLIFLVTVIGLNIVLYIKTTRNQKTANTPSHHTS
jgi:hypothetical protein